MYMKQTKSNKTKSKIHKKSHKRTKKRGGMILSKNTPKSILKPSTMIGKPKDKKIIRMYLQGNKIREYELSEEEKKIKKQNNGIDLPNCYDVADTYPCKYEDTVFNTKEEKDEYYKLKKDRNVSTDYRTKKEHYNNINAPGKRIPTYYRYDDPRSGAIYDGRDLTSYQKSLYNKINTNV